MYPLIFSKTHFQFSKTLFSLLAGLSLSLFSLALGTNWANAQSVNLATNPTIAGPSSWYSLKGATYEPSVSRGADGSGSIELGTVGSLTLNRTVIPVTPGREYEYSAFMKDNGVTQGTVALFIQVRTTAGTFKRNIFPAQQFDPISNGWYKTHIVYTPSSDEWNVQLYVVRYASSSSSNSQVLWLDDVYFGETSSDPPELLSPAPSSVLPGSSATFSWTANGTSVSQWWIHVGTSQGGFDIFDSGSLGGALSTTASGLPTNGGAVWVRLWYLDPSSWKSIDVPYTASSGSGGGSSNERSPNLAPNSPIAGTDSWYFLHGASYDPSVSRKADGSGSIKLSTEGSLALTKAFPVVPGKKYTYSFYMKDNGTLPALVQMFVQVRTNAGTFKRNAAGSRQGTKERNTWYESSVVFIPNDDEFSVQLFAVRQVGQSPEVNNVVWLDDVYFGEGVAFEEAPTPKQAFQGSMTRVDASGNIEVLEGNSWIPFFPLCIYADGRRPDWGIYSSQGFNCNIWAGSAGFVQKAKDTTSSFNPNGMMSGFEVSAFTYEREGWAYKDWDLLRSRLSEIKDAGLMNHLLMYFWDNENGYYEWDTFATAFGIIKQEDMDNQGNRMHPIYGLQGNHGVSRMYNNSTVRMTDIVGTYATNHNGGFGASPAGLIVQRNTHGQDNPVSFTQLNYGVGIEFRSALYEALIDGAKGMGFWRDTYNDSQLRPSIEQLPWWPDFPNLRREIDQLLPLLREPLHTTWSVTHQEGLDIEVGTRMHQGKGHIILINKTQFSKTVTFTMTGLPYTASEIQDYFTGQSITLVSNNTFAVTIAGKGLNRGTAVYRVNN